MRDEDKWSAETDKGRSVSLEQLFGIQPSYWYSSVNLKFFKPYFRVIFWMTRLIWNEAGLNHESYEIMRKSRKTVYNLYDEPGYSFIGRELARLMSQRVRIEPAGKLGYTGRE